MLPLKLNHRLIYIAGLIITACSLPFSVFTTSIGLIILVVNFLFEGNWNAKVNNVKKNKALWFALLVYAPVLYSLFYSSNVAGAIKELRLWLPFLIVPLVVAMGNPLKLSEFKWVMLSFILAVFVATAISMGYFKVLSKNTAFDIRQISPFISHIRYALMVNLAIVILIYFIFTGGVVSRRAKLFFLVAVLWFIFFLVTLQSLTGIIMLLLLITYGIGWLIFVSKNSTTRFTITAIALAALFLLASVFTHKIDAFYKRNYVDLLNLPKQTINGNTYQHDTLRRVYENGNLVYINICPVELKNQWERRSNFPFQGLDKKGQLLSATLIRYLASLGLTKDSIGISKLDSIDIQLVENGATSIVFRNSTVGLNKRIYQLLWEFDAYKNEGTISKSSVIQRLVYAKAAWSIIDQHPLFGVGWGDLQKNLNEYYTKNVKNLPSEHWFFPHNQYLTVWASTGLVGLIIFLVGLIAPIVLTKKFKHFLPLYFLLMIMISMLNEDTFETHIGITFAALFGSLFIFGYPFVADTDEPK